MSNKIKDIFIILLFVISCVLFMLMIQPVHAEASDDQDINPVSELNLSNYGSYPDAVMWLNCLCTFRDGTINDNAKLIYYITDVQGGTINDAIMSSNQTTVGAEKEYVGDYGIITTLRTEKYDYGLLIHDLKPGQYYIACKIETDSSYYYAYKPFIIYKSVYDYIKAGLDIIIRSYKNNWFVTNGSYVGLDSETDDYGNQWEAWTFTALQDVYNLDGEENTFGILDPFLHPNKGEISQSYLGRYNTNWVQSDLPLYGSKNLFKDITSIAACGYDPRNIFGKNYVKALVDYFYDGEAPAINSDGKVYLTEDPDSPIDLLVLSYGLLGLKIAGAGPGDGFTQQLEEAMIKTMADNYQDRYTQDVKQLANDTFFMSLLPVKYISIENENVSKLKSILVNSSKLLTKYNMGANGANAYVYGSAQSDSKWGDANADTLAVTINTLQLNGITAEDMSKGEFQKEYGNFLTALCGEIVDGGVLYGGTVNRMATYQTLFALVDLYNNKSCFDVAHEKYQLNFPEYFTDGYRNLDIQSVSSILDQQYTGKAVAPGIEVKGEQYTPTGMTERILKEGLDYTVEYKNNVEPGVATAIITGIGDYYGTKEVKFNIVKDEKDPVVTARKKQPMTVKPVLRKVSFKKLKKKAQSVKGALVVKKNRGKVTYKKLKGSSAKLSINKKTGKITVKKKTRKGTYKIRVKVTAAGNKLFKAGSKTVLVKVKVK